MLLILNYVFIFASFLIIFLIGGTIAFLLGFWIFGKGTVGIVIGFIMGIIAGVFSIWSHIMQPVDELSKIDYHELQKNGKLGFWYRVKRILDPDNL